MEVFALQKNILRSSERWRRRETRRGRAGGWDKLSEERREEGGEQHQSTEQSSKWAFFFSCTEKEMQLRNWGVRCYTVLRERQAKKGFSSDFDTMSKTRPAKLIFALKPQRLARVLYLACCIATLLPRTLSAAAQCVMHTKGRSACNSAGDLWSHILLTKVSSVLLKDKWSEVK